MKLNEILKRAKENKSNTSTHVDNASGVKFTIEFRPNSNGFNGKFTDNTYYAYMNMVNDEAELVGDLYVTDDAIMMYSDKTAQMFTGLKEVKDIERVHFADDVAYIEAVEMEEM